MTTQQTDSQEELARRWQARIASGAFSPRVKGLGTIRVMGRSGDTPVNFPRIESLAALTELEPDEQWAVRMAEAIVSEASHQHRAVFAVQPGTTTVVAPTPIHTFDPMAESLVVVARVAGG